MSYLYAKTVVSRSTNKGRRDHREKNTDSNPISTSDE